MNPETAVLLFYKGLKGGRSISLKFLWTVYNVQCKSGQVTPLVQTPVRLAGIRFNVFCSNYTLPLIELPFL